MKLRRPLGWRPKFGQAPRPTARRGRPPVRIGAMRSPAALPEAWDRPLESARTGLRTFRSRATGPGPGSTASSSDRAPVRRHDDAVQADGLRWRPVTAKPEAAVLAANLAFYAAFAERDADAMSMLWAREHVVACIHPGRDALHGRGSVMASWRAILESPEGPEIDCSDATAIVLDDVAFVTCIEQIGEAKLAATNIFALEGGEWRLVHHHAGPLASM